MRKLFSLVLVVSMGCASTPRPVAPTIAEARWVETRELPADPADEALDDYLGEEDDVRPYEPEDPEIEPGIWTSERRAARDGLYRLRYRELRILYAQDRLIWAVHREAYETRLQLAATELENLRPTWWSRSRGEILGVTGFVIGVLSTVAITFAVSKAN